MYNSNRLEWHLGDEPVTTTPQGTVWSCRIASEAFGRFNRLAVALAKSQDHRASCGVFAFGVDRQGALANGLHGLNPRNTTANGGKRWNRKVLALGGPIQRQDIRVECLLMNT